MVALVAPRTGFHCRITTTAVRRRGDGAALTSPCCLYSRAKDRSLLTR